jgi:hypothetical protein
LVVLVLLVSRATSLELPLNRPFTDEGGAVRGGIASIIVRGPQYARVDEAVHGTDQLSHAADGNGIPRVIDRSDSSAKAKRAAR